MPALQASKVPVRPIQKAAVGQQIQHIKQLNGLSTTCRGPQGKLKMLQNQMGGNLSISSSSARLFSCLSYRNPTIQMLTSIAQGNLNAYSDGGLFLISLSTQLIISSEESGLKMKIMPEIFETFLAYALQYLKSEKCPFKFRVSLSDIKVMSSVVTSILSSKPFCVWSTAKIQFITHLLLECFINSISESAEKLGSSERIFIVSNEGSCVESSQIIKGLLLEAPELSKFKVSELDIRKNSKRDKIKVAIVTVSMSGDLDEMGSVKYETDSGVDIEEAVLEELARFCDHLVERGVGLVLCQKVVHPQLKCRLRHSNTLVVDRMGLKPVKYLLRLSGGQAIQCLSVPLPDDHFGLIAEAQHCITNSKSYLHLTGADNCVSTLVLSHHQEQGLQELRGVCSTVLDTLDQLVQSPYVLAGAGCWQAGLAQYLLHKVHENSLTIQKELEVSEKYVSEAAQIFSSSLLKAVGGVVLKCDLSAASGHLFTVTHHHNDQEIGREPDSCCCGFKKAVPGDTYHSVASLGYHGNYSVRHTDDHQQSDSVEWGDGKEIVVDSLTVCVNALQSGVLAACSVLRTGQVLEHVA